MAIDNVMDDDVNYAEAAEHFIGLVLSMLTVRKYRLLTSFYLLWTIVNQLMLVMLFGLIFYSGDPSNPKFMTIISSHIWIFVVLGIEILYDVLEYTVKIWILNRVSIWIVAVICILYAVAFQVHGVLDNTEVQVLFVLRLISIFFSYVIDYCIDLELETDLREKALLPINIPFKASSEERLAFPYCGGGHNEIRLADGWQFRGTKCAWTGDNVFKTVFDSGFDGGAGSWKCYRYGSMGGGTLMTMMSSVDMCCDVRWHRFPFHVLFFVTYGIVGLPLVILTVLACAVQTTLKKCCCCCFGRGAGETIFNELLSRESY